ncbi:YncE family protein [Agarilytica rhodophyticola]|uniref:YncE family protein n=1 Tax=Agarilytica rhodophyticola TaxID=1737490 RepID=UPI000B3474D4|nr:cytochrome D1 domain-containing protein [Agarilytica rhodophyticola]
MIKLYVSLIGLLVVCSIFANTPVFAGTLLVANKNGHTVTLFDTKTYKKKASLPTGKIPHEVAVSPNGKIAVVTNYGDRNVPGNTLTLVDIRKKSVIKTIDLGKYTMPHGATWMNDNRSIIVTVEGMDGIVIVDVEKAKVEKFIKTDKAVSHMLAMDSKNERVYVSSIGGGAVTVIDLLNGKVIKQIEIGRGAEGIDLSTDDRWLWVSNRSDNKVLIINTKSLEIVKTFPAQEFPIRVSLDSNSKLAFVSNAYADSISIFDTQSYRLKKTIKLSSNFISRNEKWGRHKESSIPIGIEIDGERPVAYVAQTNADQISVIDLKTLRVIDSFGTEKEPDGMAFSSF